LKKFLLGLSCGVILAGSTAVYASGSIEALLFPAKVTFHVNGETKELAGEQTTILNYQNRTYIPLRAFSESMGAKVDYTNAAPNPQVDVYVGSSIQPVKLVNGTWEFFQFNDLNTISSAVAKGNFSFRLNLDSPSNHGEIKSGEPVQLNFWLANMVDQTTATITSHNLEIEISKISLNDKGQASRQVVWTGKLPDTPSTPLPTQMMKMQSGLRFNFEWDQRDIQGNHVAPGNYIATVKASAEYPAVMQFTEEGKEGTRTQQNTSSEMKTTVNFTIK
jgi:hypothetical protein